jgi:hypothetical protein
MRKKQAQSKEKWVKEKKKYRHNIGALKNRKISQNLSIIYKGLPSMPITPPILNTLKD